MPKKLRITLKQAEEIFNLAMKMYRQDNKKGINVSVVKKNGEYKVVHMRERSVNAFVIMEYKEIRELLIANRLRKIRKRKAIQKIHREVNYRADHLQESLVGRSLSTYK